MLHVVPTQTEALGEDEDRQQTEDRHENPRDGANRNADHGSQKDSAPAEADTLQVEGGRKTRSRTNNAPCGRRRARGEIWTTDECE
jgi:hypothetical protein